MIDERLLAEIAARLQGRRIPVERVRVADAYQRDTGCHRAIPPIAAQ